MVVEACAKPEMSDSDEEPLVFKRSNISKQNEVKQAHRQDGQTGKQGSSVGANSNGRVNNVQLHKPVEPEGPNSTGQASQLKSPLLKSKEPSSSDATRSRPMQSKSGIIGDNKSSVKQLPQSNKDSDDSEDEKPLSARLGAGPARGNSSLQIKEPQHQIKKDSDDSDDEIPLSKKYQHSSAGISVTKSSEKGKMSLLSSQQNGSIKIDGQQKSPLTALKKRPLDNTSSSSLSAAKKAKPTTESRADISKSKSVKAEKAEKNDHVPISQRTKLVSKPDQKPSTTKKTTKVIASSFKKSSVQSNKKTKYTQSSKMQPSSGDGKKWSTLVHNGVIFPPPYKPHGIKMLYKGKAVDLTPEQEEVATMYAVMKDTEYMEKTQFKENFMNDWRKILGKKHVIQDLELCDFGPIYDWYQKEKEKKKQMTTEEKKAAKEEKLKQEDKYMWAIVDGVKEKVGNFRVEPPGLFRGRGDHPKMGKLKRRIRPSDITINIGKDAPIPECPIPGERWGEIRHDNTVTWLAFWNDPVNPKECKYVFLAASSSLKGQSDKEKYEKARLLKNYIHGIRAAYSKDFASKDVTKRQIAVATYLIDKLALRAGNEKDDDEADTVGCCTLKVGNVQCMGGNILKFDFLGKDSIKYENEVEVEAAVYKAIGQFQAGKKENDDLFDELDTSKLNAHLKGLMPGLTAKVFRTYNASITLDEMLHMDTKEGDVIQKIVTYQKANKQVAIICNHQRSVSKSHQAQVERLEAKTEELKALVEELQKDLDRAKKGKPPLMGSDGKRKNNVNPEMLEKKIAQTNAKIQKLELDKDTKEQLKTVALGTSKINYLDPRISVAWCKRHEVPIEKIFNKSLLAKFAWAMDVDPDFRF
ncbi:hypothetical protein QQ045_017392 [Rhodiola kirilowii]